MISCPRCSQVLPDHATFCMSCGTSLAGGYRQPQAPSVGQGARPGYSRDGMRICHGCGAIAPLERQSCSLCGQAFSRLEERAPERPDGTYWAQLRTELTCRQCGSKSPVDEPEVEGTVTCAACHTVQAFDVGVWTEALDHAHAVADLAGPAIEGRGGSRTVAAKNPYVSIGITNTTSTLELTGMSISGGVMRTRNLSVAASPGHPLCAVCHTPVDAQVEGGTRVSTRCPTCGDRAAYEMPRALTSLHSPLVCVLCDDERVDRPEARVNATSAGMVVALHCPSCGGAIDVQVGERAATCPFCKTACRIPARTLLSLKKQNERPRPWWALFRGPSAKRLELEQAEAAPAYAANPYVATDTETRGLEEPPAAASRNAKMIDLAFSVIVPLIILGGVSLVLFLPIVWGWLNGYGSDTPPPPLPLP